MPITGWHAARMRDPGDFQKDSFVTLKIGGDKTGILLISEKLKGKTTLTEQAYRFDMDKWSVAEAKKWLKDHDKKPISFEEGVKPKKDNEPENSDNDYIGKVNLEELPEIDESELSEYADITQDLDVNSEEDTEKQLPSNIEYKTFHLELSEVKKLCINDDEKGVFVGAMASEAKDRGNDIIAPTAFDRTLANYKKAKRNIRLFYQHDTSKPPIGIISFKNVEKEGKNWNVKGELNLDTQLGSEVYSLMKQGALSDLSIGFSIADQDWKKDTRIIKDLDLWEVSVVSEPMNQKAKIEEIKMLTDGKDVDNTQDNELKTIIKFEIADVESISSKAELNETLRKSGVFSNAACEYLASRFNIKQSKSVNGDFNELKSALIEIKNIIEKL